MHRRGMIAALVAAALAAGCTDAPHNNVLLFGTDTKFGIDVSSAATQGGAPQFTVGYRRAEAVWMPLVANAHECQQGQQGCKVTTPGGTDGNLTMFKGKGSGNSQPEDAYSVFASFGAKFSGGATGTEVNAAGGLAQFFATGIAAQKLAANPNVEAALKVDSPGAAAGAAEKRRADAAVIEAEARLTEAQTAAVDAAVAEQVKVATAETTTILNRCGGPDKGAAEWTAIVNKAKAAGLSDTGARRLARDKTNSEARSRLEQDQQYRKVFIDNIGTLCPAA